VKVTGVGFDKPAAAFTAVFEPINGGPSFPVAVASDPAPTPTTLTLRLPREATALPANTYRVRLRAGADTSVSSEPFTRLARRVVVDTVAGSGAQGLLDGPAAGAQLDRPAAVVAGPAGVLYVADTLNHCIRTVDLAAGVVGTLTPTCRAGFEDGDLARARFSFPRALAVAPDGTLYVAEVGNHRIRRIRLAPGGGGTVDTLAGDGTPGLVDGPGPSARFHAPRGLALAGDGALYVADEENHAVRRVDTATGEVRTVAGDGTAALVDGPAGVARFHSPRGVALGPLGTLYVADALNHAIRRVNTRTGEVTTAAGGDRVSARVLDYPVGVGTAPDGTLYVGDEEGHRLRRVDPVSGAVATLAGEGVAGFRDGEDEAARFSDPIGVSVGPDGVAWVADEENHRIRRVVLE
jgi:DNA-binding beta-propeller fold protein YncE